LAWTFFSFALFLFLAASHPFATYPLSLRVLRRFKRQPVAADMQPAFVHLPAFSICLCAYNEERIIETTLRNLLAIQAKAGGPENVQILMYVDGATDRTADIARGYHDRIDLLVSDERLGKSQGLNRLFERSRGNIVVLIDANTEIAPDALGNIETYFTDSSIGCVCGHLTFVNAGESVTAETGSLYWRLEEHIKQLESAIGSAMGADGSLYAIRRQCLHYIPTGVADDMYLSLSVLCDGFRVVRAENVRAYELSVPSASDEFRRKIRIACQGFSTHRKLWGRLRTLDPLTRYEYFSHKVLRWFVAPLLLGAVVFAIAGIAAAWGLLLAAAITVSGIALIAIGKLAGLKLFVVGTDILQSFVATAIGVFRSLSGVLVGTWEPAVSIRLTQGSTVDAGKS
jgi:cellulose synthase/poly-beta-1,6-N-acetylglucosamine synthase-like glycosyltransferase